MKFFNKDFSVVGLTHGDKVCLTKLTIDISIVK